MGRADNRRTPKSLRRKAQRKKKARVAKKIAAGAEKKKDAFVGNRF